MISKRSVALAEFPCHLQMHAQMVVSWERWRVEIEECFFFLFALYSVYQCDASVPKYNK